MLLIMKTFCLLHLLHTHYTINSISNLEGALLFITFCATAFCSVSCPSDSQKEFVENKSVTMRLSSKITALVSYLLKHFFHFRSDLMEPPWVQPDRLSPRVHPQGLTGSSGGPCSQHWTLEQMGLLSKECDAVLAGRRSHATPMGSLALMSQPYMNSAAAQQNLLGKPTANQYKSKLDRIEALKATAASLSSRIESEAKKLAGAGINYGTMWNSDHEFMQENQDDGRWAKAVSPPVREENEDAFSARIQKMLGTCMSHAAFDDNLPGVGNLSEFKKLPETIRPHTAAVSLGMRSPAGHRHEGLLGHLSKRQTDSLGRENQAYGQNKAVIPQESSIDSISEGPLLSDGSLSEEDGGQHKQLPLKMLEALKETDFCVRERNAFEPIKEFQKEAEKYLPLYTQTSGVHSKGPWEELAKGSPHSVINIFAKSYQLHGKGKEKNGRIIQRSFELLFSVLFHTFVNSQLGDGL